MKNVISLHYVKQIRDIRHLDLSASHAALEHCLSIIGLNDLSENVKIKEQIKIAINKLEQAK